MKEQEQEYDVGVIVGRFQVPALHTAHRSLIDHVASKHDKVIIFLGVSPLWVTTQNPLDFEARKQMLTEAYPDINVLYVKDVDSDKVWSKKLDVMISDQVHPGQTAILYGSRDSFIDRYHGRYPTRELEQDNWVSGTEIRRQVARAKTRASNDFRAGVVWASQARFPTAYATIDVAVFRKNGRGTPLDDVLLVRKPDEPLWRFIGGFTDPDSETDEQDARREVGEESGVEIGDLRYVGSYNIDDWRYRPEADCIRTRLFVATYVYGDLRPRDDEIAEARWFPFGKLRRRDLMPAHRDLLVAVRDHLSIPRSDTRE